MVFRSWRLGLLAVGVAILAGCQRGCLAKWLASYGVGEDPGTPTVGSMATQEVDCADGLARCEDGVVKVSLVFHHPDPCHGSPEQCTCPWQKAAVCDAGCVVEGVGVEMSREQAVVQLCAPGDGGAPNVKPDVPGPRLAACDEGYQCSEGMLIGCRPGPRNVAICANGCVSEGATVDDGDLTDRAAALILCARGP